MTRRRTTIWMTAIASSVLASVSLAQSPDDIGPAVDTSADLIEPAVDTSASVEATPADESPAVDTSANRETRPAPSRGAIDSLSLDASQITGNQELPQVLYIVPWKSSDLGDLVGRPVNTLLDEVLAPADREVFIRQVGYYEDLHGDGEDDS